MAEHYLADGDQCIVFEADTPKEARRQMLRAITLEAQIKRENARRKAPAPKVVDPAWATPASAS